MNKRFISSALKLLPLGFGVLAALPVAATTQEPNTFQALLAESGMAMRCDSGYRNIEVTFNELLQHEMALRSEDDQLEVRFAIRPLSRIRIEYDDPHSAAPQPEHIFPMLFQSLLERLAGSGHSPYREYPPNQARAFFNADWAAAAVFDVRPELQSDFKQGLLVAIHGNGRADGYSVILFNEYNVAKNLIHEAERCLAFLPNKRDRAVEADTIRQP